MSFEAATHWCFRTLLELVRSQADQVTSPDEGRTPPVAACLPWLLMPKAAFGRVILQPAEGHAIGQIERFYAGMPAIAGDPALRHSGVGSKKFYFVVPLARSMYFRFSISSRTTSPVLMNWGTMISRPFSNRAGFHVLSCC